MNKIKKLYDTLAMHCFQSIFRALPQLEPAIAQPGFIPQHACKLGRADGDAVVVAEGVAGAGDVGLARVSVDLGSHLSLDVVDQGAGVGDREELGEDEDLRGRDDGSPTRGGAGGGVRGGGETGP